MKTEISEKYKREHKMVAIYRVRINQFMRSGNKTRERRDYFNQIVRDSSELVLYDQFYCCPGDYYIEGKVIASNKEQPKDVLLPYIKRRKEALLIAECNESFEEVEQEERTTNCIELLETAESFLRNEFKYRVVHYPGSLGGYKIDTVLTFKNKVMFKLSYQNSNVCYLFFDWRDTIKGLKSGEEIELFAKITPEMTDYEEIKERAEREAYEQMKENKRQ